MEGADGVKEIAPQPGFQWKVLECSADVAILGGTAGCGKTWCLLLEAVRWLTVRRYNAMIFRRENIQIFNTGGLWDKGVELFTSLPFPLVASIKEKPPTFRFPPGSTVQFGHINQTMDVLKYQGAEIAYIGFDELTHFERYQFFYMLSRNRSTCGVRPIIRASTNPQGSGWVKDLIQWWLYPDNHADESLRALPIPERSGVLRYFVVVDNKTVWGETAEECWNMLPEKHRLKISKENIKSLTFIGGTLNDNKELLRIDPGYVGSLMAQEETDRVQLMDGRWTDVNADAYRLYLDAEIYDMYSNTFVQGTGVRYMTADVALEGSDTFSIGIWNGWVLEKVFLSEQTKPEEVQPMLEKHAKENRVPRSNIAFDANGVGAMLKGYLKHAFPFVGSMQPMMDKEEVGMREEAPNKPNYLNLRAQVYWKFKQVLADREVYVAVNDIDLQNRLTEELKAIKKAETRADKKLQLIPKEEIHLAIKRSPDIADMLTMRCVFELVKRPKKPHKRKVRGISSS